MPIQEDQERLYRFIRATQNLRLTDPNDARRREVCFCRQWLKELEAIMPADPDEAARIEERKEKLERIIAGKVRLEIAFPCPQHGGRKVPIELSEFEDLESSALTFQRLARSVHGKQRKDMEAACATLLKLRDSLGFRFYPELMKMAFPESTFVEGTETLQ